MARTGRATFKGHRAPSIPPCGFTPSGVAASVRRQAARCRSRRCARSVDLTARDPAGAPTGIWQGCNVGEVGRPWSPQRPGARVPELAYLASGREPVVPARTDGLGFDHQRQALRQAPSSVHFGRRPVRRWRFDAACGSSGTGLAISDVTAGAPPAHPHRAFQTAGPGSRSQCWPHRA